MAATKRRADFTDVKEGGQFRPRRKPEGDYAAKCVAVDDHQFKDETKVGWVFTFKVKGDERSSYPVYASTEPKELWKIRKMFMAAGIAVPKRAVLVDPNKLVGKEMGIALEDDEYEGRQKSTIADWMPLSDLNGTDDDYDDEDEDEVEEAPPPRKRAKKAAPPPEDDDDYDDEDEEDEEPAPRRRAAKKATRRRQPEPEDDEEDDEDEAPPPRKRAANKASRRRRQEPEDDDDDDLNLEEV